MVLATRENGSQGGEDSFVRIASEAIFLMPLKKLSIHYNNNMKNTKNTKKFKINK